jgi:hypothetical protein
MPVHERHVLKPSGHFQLLLRVCLNESELADHNTGALKNNFHVREKRIAGRERAHDRLAGLVENGLAVVTRQDADHELDIIAIAGLNTGLKLPAEGLRKIRKAAREQPAAAELEHRIAAHKPLPYLADGVVGDVREGFFEAVKLERYFFVAIVIFP